MKTEPAFALAPGRTGDPYLALLDLAGQHDGVLVSAPGAGFGTTGFESGS